MNPPPAPESDEFYIGYENVMPPGIGRRLRHGVGAILVLAAIAGALALAAHERLVPARFDFGRPDDVTGDLSRMPYPSLTVEGDRVWLAARGKHGADALVAGVPEGRVALRGAVIARGAHRMLEVVPGSVRAAGPAATPASPVPRPATAGAGADVTLTGEIVDAKCFLGVMNPGEGTVHRDCARLCLRGGLPPMLLVRGGLGEEALVVLVSSDGRAIGRDLAGIAGVPVEVRGRLTRDRGTLVLHADPAQYRLVPAPAR
jgi:hypothetical protein